MVSNCVQAHFVACRACHKGLCCAGNTGWLQSQLGRGQCNGPSLDVWGRSLPPHSSQTQPEMTVTDNESKQPLSVPLSVPSNFQQEFVTHTKVKLSALSLALQDLRAWGHTPAA